jgi:NAD-dependent DNA ligase
MTATYDIATDAGKVRALCGDTNMEDPLLYNEEIAAFLVLESSDVRRGAAMALETIATRQVLLLKVIKALDIQTDGAKVAESLMKRAAELRKQAEDLTGQTEDTGFEIVEQIYDDFGYREQLDNILLREE